MISVTYDGILPIFKEFCAALKRDKLFRNGAGAIEEPRGGVVTV